MKISPIGVHYHQIKNCKPKTKIKDSPETTNVNLENITFKGRAMATVLGITGAFVGTLVCPGAGTVAGAAIGAGLGSQASDTGEYDDIQRDSMTRYP